MLTLVTPSPEKKKRTKQAALTTASPVPVLTYETALGEFLKEQDRKESSLALYARVLRLFFRWMHRETGEAQVLLLAPGKSKGRAKKPTAAELKQNSLGAPWETVAACPLPEITFQDVLRYSRALLSPLEKDGEGIGGKSPYTAGAYVTAVRRFCAWAYQKGIFRTEAGRGVRTAKRAKLFKKEPLTEEQARALLAYADKQAPRERALLYLMVFTGPRTIEAARACVGDIQMRGGVRVLFVHGKGRDGKDEFVIIENRLMDAIAPYLLARGIKPGHPAESQRREPLFSGNGNNNRGEALTTRTISKIAKEALQAIGLDSREYCAHSLRHTAGTLMLKAGATLEQVQAALRHRSSVTTQNYVEKELQERRMRNSGEALLSSFL
jgi:integrase/recombinase XerC/integrase/recombinase XerD